ncbi:FMN-binding protein [Flagellimonas allohymeniacidonis]|uniref:FMN-binding protein n=1 Tax=Flagellimonas allohymeniacidonis TaxID=2517819 RepID=A0A4V2HSN1_9FLAO|nr:FMN-binding protein [Allomuricauda hymeniacidonis]TAI48420.1 FMN-binding protein [Allomuricauda hymeniacidonis]
MKTKYLFLLLMPLIWSCKEKTEKKDLETVIVEVQETKKLPEELFSIAQFAGLSLSDSVEVNSQMRFLSIAENQSIDSLDMYQAIDLFKDRITKGVTTAYPIFEISESGLIVLTVVNKGYGGNIRGLFLIDKNTLEIKKVAFEHMAESEGYGAAITYSSFENQFVGTKINFQGNSFGLNQDGKDIIKGGKTIDGISGATITSRLTVQMVNEELKKHKNYFIN